MARHLHLAAILQYSEPLLKKIEDYLLKFYASVLFVPKLEEEADHADRNIKRIKEHSDFIRLAVEELRGGYDEGALEVLKENLMPLIASGVLQQFNIRPERLVYHLVRGNRDRAKKYLDRLNKLADALEKEAQEVLGDQAKKMREDIKKWKSYYDEDFRREMEEKMRRREPPDLEIELKESDFPFLDEKFKRRVKKARGPYATVVDQMPTATVKLRLLQGLEAGGAWNGMTNELLVNLPPFARAEGVKADLQRILKHELRHMTQTVMAKALGINEVRIPESGGPVFRYKPAPGMPSQDLMNPDIVQMLRLDDPRIMRRRDEIMREHKLRSVRPVYTLDDLEFYTQLADAVVTFEEFLEANKDLTPAQQKTAFDLFTNNLVVPRSVQKVMAYGPRGVEKAELEEAKKWLEKHDPQLGVFSKVFAPDTFFRHQKWYREEKWKKAVKEFAKAVGPKMKPTEPKVGLEEMWEKFLEERYDGGKAKIRNPNPKTRDRYPEISITYLMKQSDPAYSSERQKIRREFAAWRTWRQPRQEGLFARPPR